MLRRPSAVLLVVAVLLAAVAGVLVVKQQHERRVLLEEVSQYREMVRGLGLTDLVLTTEARYTRHPALSDSVVVGMDHPKALDHFPSTMFLAPVKRK